jgi:hypothetical protein
MLSTSAWHIYMHRGAPAITNYSKCLGLQSSITATCTQSFDSLNLRFSQSILSCLVGILLFIVQSQRFLRQACSLETMQFNKHGLLQMRATSQAFHSHIARTGQVHRYLHTYLTAHTLSLTIEFGNTMMSQTRVSPSFSVPDCANTA